MAENAEIIVTGFHRSGTSMAMQALARAGVYVGHSLIGASASNQDGHYEDIETVQLHDDWLRQSATDWCHQGKLPDISCQDAASRIRGIANRLNAEFKHANAQGESATCWGLKDPRATLFLEHWFNALRNPHGVFVYRHYASCLLSLQRRQALDLLMQPELNENAIRFWTNPSIALRSWLVHNQALLQQLQRTPDRCVLLSQEAQIAGVSLAGAINTTWSLGLQTDADSGVDQHKTQTAPTVQLETINVDETLIAELEQTWEQLQSYAFAPATQYPDVRWVAPDTTTPIFDDLEALNIRWDEVGVQHVA